MRDIWFAALVGLTLAWANPAGRTAAEARRQSSKRAGADQRRSGARQARRADHDRRIRLDELPALRPFLRGGAAEAPEELDRHRQGRADHARLPARPGGAARGDGGTLRPARPLLPARRNAVCDTGQMGRWRKTGRPRSNASRCSAGSARRRSIRCLANETIKDQVAQSRLTAAMQLGVDSTPTFFINGTKYQGDLSFEALDKLLSGLSPEIMTARKT